MATVTKPIALDESLNTTELSSRNVADVLAQELSAVATAIGGIAVPSADHVSYDNSVSGLSATDVQNALDEIVSDIPTVNNGTLTIQQNGTSIGSFSANTASNVTANIKTPTADKKTTTSEFSTADGGLLSKCLIDLVPVQSGSGDPYPAGGGKNKYSVLVGDDTFTDNVSGTSHSDSNGQLVINMVGSTNSGCYSANGSAFKSVTGGLSGTYTVSCDIKASTNMNIRFRISSSGTDLVDFTATTSWQRKSITLTLDSTERMLIFYNQSSTSGTITVKDVQIESGSTATDYAPYSNVRPISGHTEADLDVKDGDNVTQHTYQVQIGSTVYGGYDEIVGGNGKNTYDYIDLGTIAESSWGRATDHTYNFFYCSVNVLPSTPDTSQAEVIGVCSAFKVLRNMTLVDFSDTDWGDNTLTFVLKNQGTQRILIRCDSITTVSALKTLLNGVQLVYKVTTPTDITTTPQQIETLAGQNNLSTPLSGQSIETNGVEYKELFTFADVKEYVDKKIPDAPTTDGTYTLQAVVSGGVPTYSWT